MSPVTLDDAVADAVNLLPPLGTEIEFDAYKAQLYAANPNNGRDAFAHMIKRDVINKNLAKDANGKTVVMLSRKA